MNELKAVTDWHTLGLNLGILHSTLDEVEHENSTIKLRKSDMLHRWLNLKPEAAWEDVVSALRMMDKKRVAKDIEEKYCGVGKDVHTSARGDNKFN